MSHRSYVTTVIAGAKSKKLDTGLLDALRAALDSHRATWLHEGIAIDLFHEQPVAALPASDGVDIVTQPATNRRKQMLISDMDSTLIEQECIDELADFVGLKAQVSAITERAMNGEIDFKDALRERVALLKGLPESALQEAYSQRITLMSGAAPLLATMKAHGAYCLLVSGGFTFFTSRIRDALGFDADESNQLEIMNGTLTGKVIEPILDKHAKREALLREAARLSIATSDVLAVGDGANDLPMLLEAGLGVAYRAKPAVQAEAKARINHSDLSALLYLQGYAKNEWR